MIRDHRKRRPWYLIAGFAFIVLLALWSPVRTHELPPDTPWQVLVNGADLTASPPVLSDTLQRLNTQPIRLTGFMYPLVQQREQSRFVLSPYPPGCAFHVPGNPASLVEVFASEPIQFTYDPVAVQGTFLLSATEDGGVRYQIERAIVEDLP